MRNEVGATTARRRLRMTLKAIREEKKYSLDYVRNRMEWSISKIIRIESGAVSITVNDLKVLLDFYDVRDTETTDHLLQLARLSRQRHWASEYRDLCSHSYMDFLGYEDDARKISHFHPLFVPGLLQTREYAEAIIKTTAPRSISPAEIQARVRLRLARQDRVFEPSRQAEVHIAVEESALSRPIGGDDVLRRQIDHLKTIIARGPAKFVIVPTRLGGHLGLGGPFSLLEFESNEDPDIVYLDNAPRDIALVENPAQIVTYRETFQSLTQLGLTNGDALQKLDELTH